MINQILSHYQILEKIGEGGMGEVYRALDTRLDRDVALKFLPDEYTRNQEAKDRFIREAKTASALDHPNICTIHEIAETEAGQLYLVMACYDGMTLRDRMSHGPLPVDDAVGIALEIAKGLSAAHESGIVHRDIKPENIMLTSRGEVKILDFGLARLDDQMHLTKEITTLGTVEYMSPEQAEGGEVDLRTDLWSLGVVMYEMLTGEKPFKGEKALGVIHSIVNNPVPQMNSGLPGWLVKLVTACLDKDPAGRPHSADEVIVSLGSASKPRTGNRWALLGIVIAMMTLVLVARWVMAPPKPVSLSDMPSIAVMYFENATGDEESAWLAKGLPHMLITSLEQSPDVRVVGYQRLYDALHESGNGDQSAIDRTSASRIAKEVNASVIVLGSIMKWGERYRLDFQLENIQEKRLLAADSVVGDDVFSLVDDMAERILLKVENRKDLGSSLPLIGNVTTKSPDAYRYFLKGRDLEQETRWEESAQYYLKALDKDSTFALAYLSLWRYRVNLNYSTSFMDSILNKAVYYSGFTSEKERLNILAEEAYYRGHWSQFHEYGTQLLEKYPNYIDYYELLGDYHFFRYEFDEALPYYMKWGVLSGYAPRSLNNIIGMYCILDQVDSASHYAEKYMELYPEHVSMLNTVGSLKLYMGMYEEAYAYTKKLFAMNPDFSWNQRAMALMYYFTEQYEEAEKWLSRLPMKDTPLWVANNDIIQGKNKTALVYLGQSESPELLRSANYVMGYYSEALKSMSVERAGLYREYDSYESDSLLSFVLPNMVCTGKYDQMKSVLRHVREMQREKKMGRLDEVLALYWEAEAHYRRKHYEIAIRKYSRLADMHPFIFSLYRLAVCYCRMEEFTKAYQVLNRVRPIVYELVLPGTNSFEASYAYPRIYYLRGISLEGMGKEVEAINQYHHFLTLWKNADPDLPELIDAKQRLAKLENTQ